jgi:hypothetical protein
VAERKPWFPFYAPDWFAEWRLRQQPPAVRAVVIDLRAMQWLDGEPPTDPEDIAGLSGCTLDEAVAALAFFPTCGGRRQCPKMEGIRRNQQQRSRTNSNNRKGKEQDRGTTRETGRETPSVLFCSDLLCSNSDHDHSHRSDTEGGHDDDF